MSAARIHQALAGAFLAAALAAAAPASLSAQQHPSNERGFDPEKLYQFAGVDSVSLFNLGVTVTIPLGQRYPLSERFSYGLTLVGSSKAWDFQEAEFKQEEYGQAVPERFSNAGAGFSVSLGRIVGPDSPYNDYETNRWVYIDPSGGEHVFYKDLHDPGNTATTYCTDTEFCATRDSSYLRMRKIPGTNTKREVHFPDGTIHVFERFTVGAQWEWRLTAMRDSFEEGVAGSADVRIEYSADANTWTITDRLNRSHTVLFETIAGDRYRRRLKEVRLASFGGDTAIYSFGYHPLQPIPVPCSSSLPHWNFVTASQLASVTLPDGTSYGFTFYGGGSASGTCYGAGALRGVTLPTGGSIDYVYDAHTLAITGCNHRSWHKTSVGVATRTFRDRTEAPLAIWKYSSSPSDPPPHPPIWCDDLGVGYSPPPEELTVEVLTPLKDKERYFFSIWPGGDGGQATTTFDPLEYGLPFTRKATDSAGRFKSAEVLDCDVDGENCGTPRTTYVKYERDGLVFCNFGSECYDTNRRLIEQNVVYEDGKSATTVSSSYDGFGNYRTVTLGGTFGAGNSRVTTTNYNPGNVLPPGDKWILGTYTEQTTTENGTAKREACFDAQGFLTGERIFKSGTSRGGDDVVVVNTRDAAGNLTQEEYFGGDYVPPASGLDTTQPLCSLNLGSTANDYRLDHDYDTTSGVRWRSRYMNAAGGAMSFSILEQSIDANTGLAASSTDTAGVVTSYSYDESGRLEWVKPQSGQGAWVEHVYTTDAATGRRAVEVRHRANGSETGTVLREAKLVFDDLGRLWQEHQKMADGTWSIRETLYNAMGWKSSASQLGFTAQKTQYSGYDPYGRPGTVTAPDGAQVTFSYTGVSEVARRVWVAHVLDDEHPAWTTETYDRQGRLFQVKEETDPPNAQGIYGQSTTTYTYDVGGRIQGVQQQTSAGTQNRSFIYDNRGFLRSERHPEKGSGVAGNGYVYFDEYDARGHAGRRYECATSSCVATPSQRTAHLTFTYDRAERLTAVTDVTAGSKPLKVFEYGTSTAALLRTNGRLEKATRYNHHSDFGPTGTIVQVLETYRYAGPGGSVSQRDTWHTVNGNSSQAFQQTWQYTDLGQVKELGYPSCTTPTQCSPAPRTVSFTHSNGMLTAVPGFASSIAYHPNGAYRRVEHANGVVDTQDVADGMLRPFKLSADNATATLWKSGIYSYDGAGNVSKIGNSYFLYDHVSRVVDGHVYDGALGDGFLRWQTYAYDPFGNVKSIGGDSWSPGRTTDTAPGSNRLISGTYDVAGNLTAWNGNLYAYDALGMMTRMQTGTAPGAEDWRYVYTADDERYWAFRASNPSGGSLWTLRDLDGKVLRQLDAHVSWANVRDYVYRDGQLLASSYLGEGVRHVSLDHLGTARLTTGTNGPAGSIATGTAAGCIPVPADYNGDGRSDLALKCGPGWHFYKDNGSYLKGIWTGAPDSHVPVPADYDGDGDDDVVAFDAGAWHFYDYATGAYRGVWTGTAAGCEPAPADYDGDGNADFALQCTNAWHFYRDDGSYLKGIWTGTPASHIPVPADYNGDGRDEVVAFDAGGWHFYDYFTGAYHGVFTGITGTPKPVPMDYDGDRSADFTIVTNGAWHFFKDDGSYLQGIWTGGVAGDVALAVDFTAGRAREPLVFRSGSWLFYSLGGLPVSYHVYFPFGEEIFPVGEQPSDWLKDAERKKFTGHERDFANPGGVADNLDYMHARHYNPLTGRFLGTDQANDWSAAMPQTWNRYVYGRNNPLKYVDPDGNAAQLAVVAAGAWVAAEAGLTAYDIYDTTKVLQDPNAGTFNKVSGVTLTIMGAVSVGGGLTAVDDLAGAAARIIKNAAHGRAFERSVTAALGLGRAGAKLRIPSHSGTALFRVPDGLTERALVEVKGGITEIKLTNQLRDFAAYAAETGRQFILIVPEGTKVADDLLELQTKGAVRILEVKP